MVIDEGVTESQHTPLSPPVKWSIEEELPFNEVEEDNEGQNRSRKGWILGTGFIVTSALIWRFLYLASPNRTSLLISCGLTLLWRRSADLLARKEQRWRGLYRELASGTEMD